MPAESMKPGNSDLLHTMRQNELEYLPLSNNFALFMV